MLIRVYTVDDAVLRRLPRRLLLDLPAEKDREEILKIHLKAEIFDESVSLPQLAKKNPILFWLRPEERLCCSSNGLYPRGERSSS